jgi:hypothetical protein
VAAVQAVASGPTPAAIDTERDAASPQQLPEAS